MPRINLKDYYPYYRQDNFIELPDEIVAAMKPYKTEEQSHRRRMRLHKVYSLDRGGLDGYVLFAALFPSELYERKVTFQELYVAMRGLPGKQAERIFAHYFGGMSIHAIARAEDVHPASVAESIERGLRNLEAVLKNLI